MAGKKGRTGVYKRQSFSDLKQLTELSFRAVIFALQDDSIPAIEKAKLAQPLVARRIPDKIEVEEVGLFAEQKAQLCSAIKEALLARRSISLDTTPMPD
jgi:hypothetical protein